jgi:hypothetical protein
MEMRGPQPIAVGVMRPAGFLLLMLFPLRPVAAAEPPPLKLLISVEQQSITAPFPARVTLQLHNAGGQTLWLYRRARGEAKEGSTLAIRLEPTQGQAATVAAQGAVFESVGLPHPRLVRLAAGDDYEEKATLRLAPAQAETDGKRRPLWGRYHLAVSYGAKFPNADEISRNLGATVWQGEATSNRIEMELLPPPAEAQASVAGTVSNKEGQPVRDALVTLSDQEERLVDQARTDSDGRYAFTQLPFGLYWVTARAADATLDEAVFRHVELSMAAPAATLDLLFLPEEIYEAKKILHKPVLLLVTDSAGRPLNKVTLEITWSSGTVLDNVKGETLDDGMAAVELMPGRNYVTLKRRGCPKEDQRIDVAEGGGVDDFRLRYECAK